MWAMGGVVQPEHKSELNQPLQGHMCKGVPILTPKANDSKKKKKQPPLIMYMFVTNTVPLFDHFFIEGFGFSLAI